MVPQILDQTSTDVTHAGRVKKPLTAELAEGAELKWLYFLMLTLSVLCDLRGEGSCSVRGMLDRSVPVQVAEFSGLGADDECFR